MRPIGLCSIIYKLTAHLLATRLYTSCNNSNLIPPNFYAYLKGRSPCHAVRIFRDRLQMVEPNRILCGLQVDFSGAYDFLSRSYTMDLLEILGFGQNFINAIWNSLQGVKIKTNYYDQITPDFEQSSGVTQGSPLSVQIYSIACIPLTIKLELCKNLLSYQPDFDKKHVKISKQLLHYSKNPPPDFDSNYILKKSSHYADDGLSYLVYENINTLISLLHIYDTFGYIANQHINRDKTFVFFSSMISQDEINQILSLGFLEKNIIFPGGNIKFVGNTCIISPSQFKADYQTFKNKADKICNIINKWDLKSLTIKGRVIIANQLCASQLTYFYPNMTASENWFTKIQNAISSFVNKKKLTIKKLHFLHKSRGGTSTPYLYIKYLISKSNWIKTFIKYENMDRALWPDFCTLIFNLKNKYYFPPFSTLVKANDQDWIKLSNLCFFQGLTFWGNTFMEFIKLRKFSTKQKNTNKTKISLWQDFSIFGSHEIRHLHALKKTARCGASPHQLLRPPDPLSLSSRSPMTADIIDVLKWYKLGHFIK